MATDTERVKALEDEMIQVKIDVAVAKSDISFVKNKLDKIDANVSKLIWIVLAAVLGAILKSLGLF